MKKMTQLETYRKALELLSEVGYLPCVGTDENNDTCGVTFTCRNCHKNAKLHDAVKILEALSAQGGQGMDHPPKNLEEFKVRLFNDPVAYAYYNMGRAVEQDYRTDPDERASRNFEALYAVINEGFGKRILPDYWLTAEEPFPTPTAQEPPTQPELKHDDPQCGADKVSGTHLDSCGCKCHGAPQEPPTETQERCPKCKTEVEWVVPPIPGVKPFFQCQDPDCNWMSDDDFPVTESKMKGVD